MVTILKYYTDLYITMKISKQVLNKLAGMCYLMKITLAHPMPIR
jgi:hypothetical protein